MVETAHFSIQSFVHAAIIHLIRLVEVFEQHFLILKIGDLLFRVSSQLLLLKSLKLKG